MSPTRSRRLLAGLLAAVANAGLEPGTEVLDVATGSGNAGHPAKRA